MKDDFLSNYLIAYIEEKKITKRFIIDMIINDFYFIKKQEV